MNDTKNICRTCLRSSSVFAPLFDYKDLPRKIEVISSVQVTEIDDLPSIVCAECVININSAFNFRRVIVNSESILRKRLTSQKSTDVKIKATEDSSTPIDNLSDDLLDDLVNDINNDLNDENEPSSLDANDDSNKDEEDVKFKNKCNKCGFIAISEKQLVQHKKRGHSYQQKRVQSVQKIVCDVCGKFISTDNMKKHLIYHSNDPISCQICEKVCRNSEVLRLHIYLHKQRIRTCEYCGLTFNTSNYSNHVKRHHTGTIKKYHCHLCEKKFDSRDGLRRHVRHHTGERPYPCEYCEKGFSTSYALKTHKRRHTNERPYVCEYCSMGFPQKVSLKTHLKSKHPDENLNSI